MEWSPQQDNALKAVAEWLKNPDQQVFRMFGYAGTGKTTLAKHLAAGVEGGVLFAAFTGKAAHVLQQKGCVGATTIHSLIYCSREKGKRKLKELEEGLIKLKMELVEQDQNPDEHKRVIDIRKMILDERDNLARPAFTLNIDSAVKFNELVIIDECSMVDDQMGSDLLGFGTKVLVLGDEAQLPPVYGDGFFTGPSHKPDIMLDEIHRQARDNPIIDLATKVRMKEDLSLGQYGESKIIDINDVKPEEIVDCDQLIVGKNATRYSSNKRIRSLKGMDSEYPLAGDKVVCLRNNHDKGLLNGSIWNVIDVGQVDPERTYFTVVPQEGGDEVECETHSHYFLGKADELPYWERRDAEEFDFGYALTCHKAQGSQWDNVIVFDESHCFRQNRHKWLYTAITRAAEKLTIVRGL